MTSLSLRLLVVTLLCLAPALALAQFPRQMPRQTPAAATPAPAAQKPTTTTRTNQRLQAPRGASPAPNQPMRKASELIRRQDPISVNQAAYARVTPETARVTVSLSKQRAYLFAGDELAIDTPISSGKRAGMTPTGSFRITQKNRDHRSNIYGDFVDGKGRTVRGGVSVRIDSAPSGTRFLGAPMKYFMRLTDDGVGMHVGILPGYPASHGCIRMPTQTAEMFFNRVKLGTPVQVVQ